MSSVKRRTLEESVASFAVDFEYSDIPERSRERVVRLLHDQLALQIGLSELPWSRHVDSYAKAVEKPGDSTIMANGRQVDAGTAAFVNASFGHGFEYDDIHEESHGHPGSVVVSTALAIGEHEDATMDEVVTALVVGYEVYARIGKLGSPSLLERGWQPHAVLAPFAAAAVTGVLQNVDESTMATALSIAASHASGITEYTSTGGSIKRVHAGIGARNGIESVRMALHGVTGPRRFLTGSKGFLHTFAGVGETKTDDISSTDRLEIDTSWIKPYCACGATHAYIDAVREISPKPNTIEQIVADVQPAMNAVIGTDNENIYSPETIVEAQYSLPFQIALTIHGFGNGFRSHQQILDGELLDDSELLQTANRVDIHVDENLGRQYRQNIVGGVEIEYSNSKTDREFVEFSKGRSQNPMSEDEFRVKFDELTTPVLGKAGSASLYETIAGFDPDDSVADLTSSAY